MARLTLAQVEYLSQDLTHHFKDFKCQIFKASLELEKTQKILKSLVETYEQWLREDLLNHESLIK